MSKSRIKLIVEQIRTVLQPCKCEQCQQRRQTLKQYALDNPPLRRARTIWQHHRHKGNPP